LNNLTNLIFSLQLLSESQNDEELPIKINFVNVDLINYKNEFVLQSKLIIIIIIINIILI
jgi:hypothetical protein